MKGFSGRLKKSWLRKAEKIQEMEVTKTTQAATGSEWWSRPWGHSVGCPNGCERGLVTEIRTHGIKMKVRA